jgi:uncharacterized membrane protein
MEGVHSDGEHLARTCCMLHWGVVTISCAVACSYNALAVLCAILTTIYMHERSPNQLLTQA